MFDFYFAHGIGCEVLWWVCLSVYLFVREDIFGTTREIFTNFLCMLPMSVAWSSPGMLTIGFIVYWREGGDGSAQRGWSLRLNLRLHWQTCDLSASAWAETGTVRYLAKFRRVNRCGVWRYDDFVNLGRRIRFLSEVVFTTLRCASVVYAVAVCPSICPSQLGILPKRLNVGSRKRCLQ